MRRPGIEPGSTAWKAAMLTTIPPAPVDASQHNQQVPSLLGFVPASKMRLRRGLGYPTQITVPFVFTVCNPTLQKKIFTHAQKLPK